MELWARVFPVVELRQRNLEGFALAMYGDPLLTSLTPGDRLDLVVQVTQQDITGSTFRTLWHSEICRCQRSFGMGEVMTLYDVQYQGLYGTTHFLMIPGEALIVPRPPLTGESFRDIKDVCAGIGGMLAGCARLGGSCLAALDINPLACETLRANNTVVIEGDIRDPQVRRSLHSVQANKRCLLAASIPGPGHRRGLHLGSALGCPLLCHVLQTAWHMQASGLSLECNCAPSQNEQCFAMIREFAVKAGYNLEQVVLDLSHQWAARRVRWWVVLLPSHLPRLRLQAWPRSQETWLIQR